MQKVTVRFFAALVLSALTLASCTKENVQVSSTNPPPFEMIAHRGFDAQFPEDTVLAAEEAMKLGAVPECDVQFTADGEMVVIHDDTVDRTTDGTGKVSELNYSYIETLDAGSYMSKEYANVRIPKFAEYLDAVKDAELIYPEIKSYRKIEDIATFTKTILDCGFESKATIQSFDYTTVLPEIRKLSDKVRVGALCSTQEDFNKNLEIAKQDTNSILLISTKIATPENLESCENAGLDVAVWTIKTQKQLNSLYKIGYRKFMLSSYMNVN